MNYRVSDCSNVEYYFAEIAEKRFVTIMER